MTATATVPPPEPVGVAFAVVRIVRALARHPVPDHEVLDLTWAEMGIDSLDLLELAVRCEDALGGAIPDRELTRWSTPHQVVAYLESARSTGLDVR